MSLAGTDRVRLARAVALGAWCGFFAYLWASGEMTRFLGPRTYWVVPFGTAVLGLAAIFHLMTLRDGRPRRLGRGDVVGLALLLAPLVALAAVPRPDLGALAAARKATGGGAVGLIAPPAPRPGEPPSFIDLHFANSSAEYAARLGLSPGMRLTLVGFVSSSDPAAAGSVRLTRFYVSCCAADAIPYSVTVELPGSMRPPEPDTWLRVSGELVLESGEWRLAAREVRRVEEPDNPYLS